MPPQLLLPLLALAVYFVGATEFMLSPMLTPLAEAFETTPAHASWLVSSYALSYAVAAPIFGLLSDRIDRRRLLLASLLLFALDGLALTLAPNFEFAIGLRIFGGLASAALIPTAFAMIADRVPVHRQAGAMGIVMLGMTFGIAAGPVFAGLLTDAFDWRAPFVLTAVGCLLTFVAGWKIIPSHAPHPSETRQARFAWICQSSVLRPLVAKGLWNGTAVAAFLLTGEVLRQRHGLGTGAVGAAVSAFGVGLGLGNVAVGFAARICKRDETMLMVAIVLIAIAISTFMLAPLSLEGGLACLTMWGAALGVAAPASTAILAKRAGENKGQVLAISESLNNLTILAVLPIAAGQLAVHGATDTMLILALSLTISLILSAADLRGAFSQTSKVSQ